MDERGLKIIDGVLVAIDREKHKKYLEITDDRDIVCIPADVKEIGEDVFNCPRYCFDSFTMTNQTKKLPVFFCGFDVFRIIDAETKDVLFETESFESPGNDGWDLMMEFVEAYNEDPEEAMADEYFFE